MAGAATAARSVVASAVEANLFAVTLASSQMISPDLQGFIGLVRVCRTLDAAMVPQVGSWVKHLCITLRLAYTPPLVPFGSHPL